MAELIEDPKKKKDSFGDAAAAASDPGVTQLKVGKPGDFPVNQDGTPMQKPAVGLGAVAPVQTPPAKPGAFPGISATVAGMSDDVGAAIGKGNYGQAAGALFRGSSAIPIAAVDDVILNPAQKVGGAIRQNVTEPIARFGGEFSRAAMGMQSAANPPVQAKSPALTGYRPNEITDPRSLLNPNRQDTAQPAAPAAVAEQASPIASPVAPIAAGAVKTQGQMNMEADLRSADAMKAERLAAEGRAPQNTVTHSGNDWQARNNLRNLQVSASSMTASPQDIQAYTDAQKHDTSLQGGGTAADIANVAAANRNNEINSTAQVANARTAQQGQQFGASHELATQRLALDNRKADIADTGAQMDNATKKQLQDLNAKILKETDPAKLAVLQEKAQTLTGKYQRPDPAARDVFKAVTDPVTGKVTMYNTQTGEIGTGQPQAPKANEVRSGYRFKGGDPADQKNWEKV